MPNSVPGPQLMVSSGNQHEKLFTEFGRQIGEYGFVRAERLALLGMPILPYQPVYRFRRQSEELPVIFQIGAGIFSAFAVPPYRTWQDFSAIAKEGLISLRLAAADAEVPITLQSAVLRYIDAFSGNLLRGLEPSRFVRDTLGITVTAPRIARAGFTQEPAERVVQLAGSTGSGSLTLTVAEGIREGAPAVFADWVAAVMLPSAYKFDDENALLEKLDEAHNIVLHMFLSLTEPLRDAMQPEETDQ